MLSTLFEKSKINYIVKIKKLTEANLSYINIQSNSLPSNFYNLTYKQRFLVDIILLHIITSNSFEEF